MPHPDPIADGAPHRTPVCDAVDYATEIAFRGSVLSGYGCHLVGLWLSLVAFSLVIVLWSNTLNPPRYGQQQEPDGHVSCVVRLRQKISRLFYTTTTK